MLPSETRLITDFSQLESLAEEWTCLWERDPHATVFSRFGWMRAMWRAYGAGRSPCVPIVWRGDRVVAILPLAAKDGEVRFMADPRSDYNDLLADPEAGPEALEAAVDALENAPIAWRRCTLTNIPEGSNILASLSTITRRKGLLCYLVRMDSCPSVDLTKDADRILGEILKKKSLKYYEKKLGRLGRVDFRHLETPEEVMRHLPRLYRQHIARRMMEGDQSLFCEAGGREFYEALAAELDLKNELRFGVLEVDEKPVAYHFGFESRGTLLFYKPTFDIDYWDYSPGQVLIRRLFEYVKQRQLRKFDFTVGGESYKDRFANHVEDNYTLYLFPRGPMGRVRKLSLQAREALRRRPTAYRVVRDLARFTKRSLQKLRRAVTRDGVARVTARFCSTAWRRVVMSREEMLVFSASNAGAKPLGDDLVMTQGTLSELAFLADAHGVFLTTDKLAKAQQRLRQGDKLYLVWKSDELAHVAWVGVRGEITLSSGSEDKCRVTLEQAAPVIYDCWTPAPIRGQAVYPRVLMALLGEDTTDAREHWIGCFGGNHASRRGIEKAGFHLRYRLRRTRLFRFIVLNHPPAEIPYSTSGDH